MLRVCRIEVAPTFYHQDLSASAGRQKKVCKEENGILIADIPAPDASFDAILDSEVREHVPEPMRSMNSPAGSNPVAL